MSKGMKKIEELRSEIQENKFRIGTLEKEMEKDVVYLVDNIDTFLSLGIITQEDADKLTEIVGQDLDHEDVNKFNEILESIDGIKKRIDETLAKLRVQKTDLEV